MNKDEWKERIISATEQAGTYRPFFDSVIDTLAGILERRDEAEELYRSSGSKVLVKHVNKGGATNIEQNPVLRLINDLNRDALAYWRDLGLTPSGLRKINEASLKIEAKASALEEALNKLSSG